MSNHQVIRVFRQLQGASLGVLGDAVRCPDGWHFIPNVSGRRPSRKGWATWEACLPRWVGYPDRCTTVVIL